MPVDVRMPALSPTMTEGTLSRWLVSEGDRIQPGDVLAEIETDKATMEVEAVDGGVVGRLLVAGGSEGIAVNTVIAQLLQEGEGKNDLTDPASPPSPPPMEMPESPAPSSREDSPASVLKADKPVSVDSAPAPAGNGADGGSGSGRIRASPLARRLAAAKGIALETIRGTGPRGRVVKADVEAAHTPLDATMPEQTSPTGEVPLDPPYVLEPLTSMRRTVARRLSESKQTIPHYYLSVDCRMERLLSFRAAANADGARAGVEEKISVNDVLVKALAMALVQVPEANAQWTDEGIRRFGRVDLAVAVAVPGGLITPVLRDAARMGLREITLRSKDLVGKARAGKLLPEEYQGGTVSLTNLGMFGIKNFSAVINPPQSCILAVGAARDIPVAENGSLGVGKVMEATLSADHRIVDGAVAAALLSAFRDFVEEPARMIL